MKETKVIRNRGDYARVRANPAGPMRYGFFAADPSVTGRIAEDGSETFGRLLLVGEEFEFVPFTQEEEAEFREKHRAQLTEIFNRKNVNNVVRFPVRNLRLI